MNRIIVWKRHTNGFTLVEMVITIVISAIALSAVVPLLGEVFMRSHEPAARLAEGVDLHGAMERLVARQERMGLSQLQSHIGGEGSLYLGRFMVEVNRFRAFDEAGFETDTSGSNVLLRVTLRGASGERLTRLFAEER